MAIFKYKTKDLKGQEVIGEIDSTDLRTAVILLRKKGLIVISVSPKLKNNLLFLDKFINRVSFNDLVTFTRQLATMIGAGLVLSEAIDILEEQQTNKKFKIALADVAHDIKGGLNLDRKSGV